MADIIELEKLNSRVDLVEQKSDMAIENIKEDMTRLEAKIDKLSDILETIGSKAFWVVLCALGSVLMLIIHLVLLHVK